jgi:hypothetical protein
MRRKRSPQAVKTKSLARNNKTWTLVFRYVALLGI